MSQSLAIVLSQMQKDFLQNYIMGSKYYYLCMKLFFLFSNRYHFLFYHSNTTHNESFVSFYMAVSSSRQIHKKNINFFLLFLSVCRKFHYCCKIMSFYNFKYSQYKNFYSKIIFLFLLIKIIHRVVANNPQPKARTPRATSGQANFS